MPFLEAISLSANRFDVNYMKGCFNICLKMLMLEDVAKSPLLFIHSYLIKGSQIRAPITESDHQTVLSRARS